MPKHYDWRKDYERVYGPLRRPSGNELIAAGSDPVTIALAESACGSLTIILEPEDRERLEFVAGRTGATPEAVAVRLIQAGLIFNAGGKLRRKTPGESP